jgi:hypothetical protein
MLRLLLRKARKRGGLVAFCNLSTRQREMLAITGLDILWLVYRSRTEAVAALASRPPATVDG